MTASRGCASGIERWSRAIALTRHLYVRLHLRILSLLLPALAACSGGATTLPNVPPSPPALAGVGIFDESTSGCTVSADGLIFYRVPASTFSPMVVTQERCNAGTLGATQSVAVPSWAVPNGPTKAIFVATSLQQTYSLSGMQQLEADASASHVPMTWMIANSAYLADASDYDRYHAQNGDDVETGELGPPVSQLQQTFAWYSPHVSVDGAGHERSPAADMAAGFDGFWGITWDSRGVDGTGDMGAPWGEYCADPASYKRPQPDGGCSFLAYEWTARDLTRAYLSQLDYWYSTDPDDLLVRAGFTPASAARYVRRLIDAYAAAGETTPFVVISQQESHDEASSPDDDVVMTALYAQAVKDGMKLDTFADVNADAQSFAAQPRAVAFPYIAGGNLVPSPVLNGSTLYPATIDYHDAAAGMTFLAGQTAPQRVFEYSADSQSFYNVPLAQLTAAQTPRIESVAVSNGSITFSVDSPGALEYGAAIWSNPTGLGISGSNVYPAGRAGVVLVMQLQPGPNQISFPCTGCTGTTFTYAT